MSNDIVVPESEDLLLKNIASFQNCEDLCWFALNWVDRKFKPKKTDITLVNDANQIKFYASLESDIFFKKTTLYNIFYDREDNDSTNSNDEQLIYTIQLKDGDLLLGVLKIFCSKDIKFEPSQKEQISHLCSFIVYTLRNLDSCINHERIHISQNLLSTIATWDITKPPVELAENTCKLIQEELGYKCNGFLLMLENQNIQTRTYYCGGNKKQFSVLQKNDPLLFDAYKKNLSVPIGACGADGNFNIILPLRVQNNNIGYFHLVSESIKDNYHDEMEMLKVVAIQISIAIRNSILYQETNFRYITSMAIHELTLSIMGDQNREVLTEKMLQQISVLIQTNYNSLCFVEKGVNVLYKFHYSSLATNEVKEKIERHIHALWQEHLSNDLALFNYQIDSFFISCIPLELEGQYSGMFIVEKDHSKGYFTDLELWSLSLLAEIASVAFHNIDLHEELQSLMTGLEERVEQKTILLSKAKSELDEKAKQLQALLKKSIQAQENERARIARDLHDSVVQMITSVMLEIQTAKLDIDSENYAAAIEEIQFSRKLLNDTHAEIRHIIYDLHPPVMTSVDLVTALRQKCDRIFQYCNISCDLEIIGTPVDISPSDEVTIYRIMEESLHNIVLHSHATKAYVKVEFKEKYILMEIRDNGCGFDYSTLELTDKGHFGLISMRERISIVGGTMDVISVKGNGTDIHLTIPLGKMEYYHLKG